MTWLALGPDEWTRRYIAGLPLFVAALFVVVLALLRPRGG